jgi:hypothetical protein
MFQKVEGDHAITIKGGVFCQGDLYTLKDELFVKISGGFVRINRDGSTSHPSTRLHLLVYEKPLWADRFGRLTVSPGSPDQGRVPVLSTADGILDAASTRRIK